MGGSSKETRSKYKSKYGADEGKAFLGLESADVSQTGGMFMGFGDQKLANLDASMDAQTEPWARKLRKKKYAVGKKGLLTGSEAGIGAGNTQPTSLLN